MRARRVGRGAYGHRAPALGTLLAGVVWTVAIPAGAAALSPQVVEREVAMHDGTVRALCTSGPQEVVLVQGDGYSAETWRPVLERLEGMVGACAYERANRGGTHASPRGWFELLDEMRRTHEALGYRQGYTLVGHSVGAMYVRLFAASRPRDVAGLVLLDPAHENLAEAVQPGMPRSAWEDWMRRKRRPNADGITEAELEKRASESRLPDIPTTVVTAGRRPHGAGWDERFLSEAARRVHASILEGITHSRHVPASRSGRDIHLDDPDLAAREIVRITRMVRGSIR